MAKSEDGVGFAWSTMWAAWRGQPTNIQRLWMNGKGGLYQDLVEVMERYPKQVQDEVFGFAPDDVQKHFGYKKSETTSKKSGISQITKDKKYDKAREQLKRLMEA